ncbi:CHAT domain-containing protein [Candidatus Nitrospira salsa]
MKSSSTLKQDRTNRSLDDLMNVNSVENFPDCSYFHLPIYGWLIVGVLALCTLGVISLVFAQDTSDIAPTASESMASGEILYDQGKFNEAVSKWTEAGRQYEQGGDDPGHVSSLIHLAQAFRQEGQYEKARILLDRAFEKAGPLNNARLSAQILEGLGNVYFGLGKRKKGIELFNDGLSIARLDGDSETAAGLLNSLGNVLTTYNRNTDAIGAYTEAAVLAEATNNPRLEMTALVNSVRAAMQQGLRVNAEERLDLAGRKVALLDDSHMKLRGLLSIGLFYDDLDSEYTSHQISTTSASSSSGAKGSRGADRGIRVEPGAGPSVLDEVIVVPEIAEPLQREKFDRELHQPRAEPGVSSEGKSLRLRALESFQSAAKLARQLGDARGESYAWGHMGRLYEESQQYDEALSVTRKAVTLAQKAIAPESLYRWHWQTARIQRARGKYDEAQAAYHRAILALQPIRQEVSVAYQGRRQSFREGVGPLFFELADLLLERGKEAVEKGESTSFLAEARDTMEKFKAAELQDYFQDECVQTAQSLSTTLETEAPTSAIIYPIMLKKRLELLVNFPNGLKQYTVPVGEEAIVTKVRTLRERLQDPVGGGYLSEAQQLYDWLIRPLEEDLQEETIDTLVFVPDGALRTIPIAALHNGENHLIQNFALATTPGLTLTDPSPINREKVNMLSLGLTDGVQGFPPLPYVQHELDIIQEVYGGKQLLNQEFMVANMREELEDSDFTIVHIASHGLVESNVEDTFVLAYDEKITMDRLADLVGLFKFRKTPLELLTLSACETAAGDDKAALGLAGVAVKAGARSALATLWFIDDQVASDLVGEFYRQLQDPSLSKAQALQRAQIKVLENPKYQHPNYWSPFLLINNWL